MSDEELKPWFIRFKQFIADNKARNFWLYTSEEKLLKQPHPAVWIISTFHWSQTDEGFSYWSKLNTLWEEIAYL